MWSPKDFCLFIVHNTVGLDWSLLADHSSENVKFSVISLWLRFTLFLI